MRRRLLVGSGCSQIIDVIDKIDTVAGDICIVDNNTLDKYFIEPDTIELINPECYTPIGIVVVPASHTNNRTARIISLLYMDINNPDNGSNNGSNIFFGGTENDISTLPNLTEAPYIIDYAQSATASTQTLLGWDEIYNLKFGSDSFNRNKNPYDTKSYYGSINSSSKAAPSPYLEDGSKNPIYHDTSNTSNALADMDGKSNTKKILEIDNSYDTSWQTAITISNDAWEEFIHPAAQCCWRYHTIGTNQGDWYLPAIGELGYLEARRKTITTTIRKIDNFEIVPVSYLSTYGNASSTEYSDVNMVDIKYNNTSSNLSYWTKNTSASVRAFLSV